jgi:hypothetical protein
MIYEFGHFPPTVVPIRSLERACFETFFGVQPEHPLCHLRHPVSIISLSTSYSQVHGSFFNVHAYR